MNIKDSLMERSNGSCELCQSVDDLSVYSVPPSDDETVDNSILVCEKCKSQLLDTSLIDINHWRCLNKTMWSDIPAVQVVIWRMLNLLKNEGWPLDLLNMIYLDDDTLNWAKSGVQDSKNDIVHKDANGVVLEDGDSVTLIKDLVVKGAGFTAKRGTAVKNIALVADNPEHIEGKVENQQIVILTKFVKKAN